MSFPTNFVWGAAAAAYQIEGAALEDGKGPSVWDVFCRTPGATFEGNSGEVACDHYHRYREDVALMRGMGLRAYRLSISWPRVMPSGEGAINEKGLDFYDRLIDELLAAKVTPYVTLFHWDYPWELYCRGGWLSPDAPRWFADYARVVGKRLGDRVKHWMTLNEPQVFIDIAHRQGIHAPGLKLAWPEVLRAGHHSLLAHGRGVQALRESCKSKPTIGWAPVGVVHYPASDDPHDLEAARRATWSGVPGAPAATQRSLWSNTFFSDPVCLGHYPDDVLAAWGSDMPKFTSADLATIHQPIDFYGVNIYNGRPVRADADGHATPASRPLGYPVTTMHWPVDPPSLYWGPRLIYERYKIPVIVTENGLANPDWVSLDGAVHDPQRIDFTARYLAQLKRAIADGADVRGYFHWSILDNFEWAEGYKQRFGLIHVDFTTQKRTPKDSAQWYAQVIKSNGDLINT